MAQLLGNLTVGSIVKLKEKGTPQNYLVVHQGKPSGIYDESCNGTWLLRQDLIENIVWDSENVNKLESSDIRPWLNGIMLGKYDANIQAAIKQVKIPYRKNGGSGRTDQTGANGLSCQVFLLSGREVGFTSSENPYFPNDGEELAYFESGNDSSAQQKRIAKLNGSATNWWLRSPTIDSDSHVFSVGPQGDWFDYSANSSHGVRPAMVMPTDLLVDDSNNIIPIPTILTLTAPSIAMQGQSIPLSWTSVSVSGFDVTYQLQRNVNNEGWQNVGSSISQTSYTDTTQSGWTQVQYQVAAVIENVIGNYTQSSIIPVSDPSALVISGQDGNLGTLTSNVPYTVSSNTGNPISLTRTVNGAQVVTLTVDSGFAYDIPIADLPTGTGTIQITASVESSSGTVTQTRTWTYYKTTINIPSTGGIAQLTQNGQNIWPVTVPDAVEAPVYLGGNLNAALNKLGQAALYTKIGSPKYNQVTVDLSKVKVGDEVLLPYNDVMIPHIVVHIGNPDASIYDASCDGVWLLRKDCVAQGQWNSTNVNTLAGSTIMTTMQTYVANYGTEVQSAIKTVKIPYCVGGGSSTVNTLGNGLQCQIFPLSAYELGWTQSNNISLPIDGITLNYFVGTNESDVKRISYFNNSVINYWMRSAALGYNNITYYVTNNGFFQVTTSLNSSYGLRPCFIMPTTFNQTYYVDSSNNIHPAQEYTQGGSITDVFGYDVPICQYEYGSYVGTGVAGSSSPNSLTFGFEPKFIVVMSKIIFDISYTYSLVAVKGMEQINSVYLKTNSYPSTVGDNVVNFSGNQISWYNLGYPTSNSQTIDGQLNRAGQTYYYVAIG